MLELADMDIKAKPGHKHTAGAICCVQVCRTQGGGILDL
uniref:Uncharacterized protein n=1 Tax=Anguilla anguilla TaxID=7936 RepID=A0A0E9U9T1_ANGAN